jgi:hypothetical protein
MSNNVGTNPIKIDTVFSTFYKAIPGAMPSGGMELQLQEVHWCNPANVGDSFSLTTVDGNTILATGRCDIAGQSQVIQMYRKRITDFAVPTLTSGTLFIKYC